MPRSTLETDIRSRIESLAAELAGMIRQAALESVREALGSDGTAPARRGPGRPRESGRGNARGRRGRPSVADTDALATKVLAHIKANPGQRVSEIAAALGRQSDEMKPVVAVLLAAKEIRKTGKRRGSKYHRRSGSSRGLPSIP